MTRRRGHDSAVAPYYLHVGTEGPSSHGHQFKFSTRLPSQDGVNFLGVPGAACGGRVGFRLPRPDIHREYDALLMPFDSHSFQRFHVQGNHVRSIE